MRQKHFQDHSFLFIVVIVENKNSPSDLSDLNKMGAQISAVLADVIYFTKTKGSCQPCKLF